MAGLALDLERLGIDVSSDKLERAAHYVDLHMSLDGQDLSYEVLAQIARSLALRGLIGH